MQQKSKIEKTIRICERYPQDENMMIRTNCLKNLGKTYKFLERIAYILKINPHNLKTLAEITGFLGDKNV